MNLARRGFIKVVAGIPAGLSLLPCSESLPAEEGTFLIHCEIGVSRSPGVAAALSRIYHGDDSPWFEMDFPNRLVYRLLNDTAAAKPATGAPPS